MKTLPTKNKLNLALLTTIIILVIFGFWGDKVILSLTSQYLLNFYPQLLATFIGAALGVPVGLFINSLTEKKKDQKIITRVLIFIKTELTSDQKNIENLQDAAKKIFLSENIKKDDLKTFSKFNTILSQESYIAAQSSVAFASINNDRLMSGILNAYLNIQRIVGGVIALGEVDTKEGKVLLVDYIKLCERAKESIRFCFLEIDGQLKKFGSTLAIVE